MADLLRLTPVPLYLSGASTFLQDIAQVVDVSMFDVLDVRFNLYTLEGTGSVAISILTSMENKSDEDDWEVMGTVTFSSAPDRQSTTFPTPILAATSTVPVPLLRYIRWKVVLTGATGATVHIHGLARRRAL